MEFNIELEQEQDGRWIADVVDIPGVMVYGKSVQEATLKAHVLALRVLAEKIHFGEFPRCH